MGIGAALASAGAGMVLVTGLLLLAGRIGGTDPSPSLLPDDLRRQMEELEDATGRRSGGSPIASAGMSPGYQLARLRGANRLLLGAGAAVGLLGLALMGLDALR